MSSSPSADAELRARVDQQEAVAELGKVALETDNLDRLLSEAVEVVTETLGTDYCEVLELRSDHDEFVLTQGVGWRDGFVDEARVPTDDESQAGYTLLTEEPVIVEDLRTESRFVGPDLLRSHDAVSGVTVIIGSVDDPWGVLGTHATEEREFTTHDADFVRSVANVLASAIDNDRTKRRLREEESLKDQFVETSPVGIVVIGEDGAFEFANERAEGILGRSREELTTHTYDDDRWDAVDVDGTPLDPSELPFERVMTAGESVYDAEFGVRRPDGERVWLSVNGAPLHADGEGTSALLTIDDVTEQRQLEHELAEVYGRVSDAFFALDEEWNFTHLNERAEELINPDGRDLEGTYVWDEFPAGDEQAFREQYERAMYEQETVTFEEYYPDPLDTWFEVRAYPSETGLSVYFRDVTERKERERELERYRTIVEAVDDGVYVVDAESNFQMVNEAYAEMVGYGREELIGANASKVVDEGVIQQVHEWDQVARDGDGELPTMETELVRSDGDSVPVEATFAALPAAGERKWVRAGVVRDVSERKERERELRRNERRFEAVFEDPNILVGLLDPDGSVIDINQTAMEYVDADLEDVTGEPFWEAPWWGGGDDVQDDVREWTERAADGEYLDFETDLTRPDGERYVLSGVFRPVTNDDGEVVSIIVSDRDVTARREYERRLAESERRYRALAEYFPNGLVTLFDDDLEYTLAAGQGFDRLSVSPADVEGKSVREAWGDETADELEPEIRATLDGEERAVELQYEGRDWVVHAVPITDEHGDVFAGMTMAQDVTGRKENQRRLERYREYTDDVLDAIDDVFYIVDQDGELQRWNETLYEVSGYADDDVDGKHALEFFVEDDREEIVAGIREAFDTGSAQVEADVLTKDGDRIPFEFAGSCVEDPDGNPVVAGIGRDVTERREHERELEESERRYWTLVEHFPNGAVGLFDEDLTYTAVGGQLLDEIGVEPEDRVGTSVYEIYPDELVEQVEPHFFDALAGEANSFEVEYHGMHLRAHTLPVRNGGGEIFAGMLVVQDVTDRREMERELRQSEAKFRMLAENLDEVVWMATPDAEEFLYLNPAFESVWGIDRETLYDDATSFLDVVHPDDRERVRAAFEELPESDFDGEFRIERPDAETRWIHAHGAQVRDEDAGMTRVVGIGKDVTDRKERERELERTLDLLERTERIADVGGWEIGVDTQEVFWTDHVFEVLDVSGDEEPPLDEALDMYYEEDKPVVEDAVESALESGDSFDIEVRVVTEGDETRWLRLQGVPETVDGEVVSLRGAAQDVTERTERERELERRAREQQVVADLGQFALETDDLEELMHEATRQVADTLDNAYCKVLDLDEAEEELLLRQGVGWQEGIVGEAAVSSVEEDSQAAYTLANEHPIVVEDLATETRFSGPDLLTSHDVVSGISTVIGPFDEPWGILGTHDTGRKQFSDEDVTFVQSVSNVLAETIERHQYQTELEALITDLEASNERLEQFAYAASHDLQEPLRMVSSYLKLIEGRYADKLDEDGQEFLYFAVDGADRMRDMIDALLEYSRVETKGDPFEPVDLDDVFADVRRDLQVRIEEQDADVTADSLPRVQGDAGQLQQVFQNLLRNAIEYSGDDRPRVRVSAEREGSKWVVSVHDEGIGIDADNTDRIFQVFQRLHSHDEHPGTGIGLALCQRIIERHGVRSNSARTGSTDERSESVGGEIWVDSEPGEGSTFSFTLPALGEFNE